MSTTTESKLERPAQPPQAEHPKERVRTGAGRSALFWLLAIVLGVIFVKPLRLLVHLALTTELHSHILLVPVASLYLVYLSRDQLPRKSRPWISGFLTLSAAAGSILGLAYLSPAASMWDQQLALLILAFVCLLSAISCLILGREYMRAVAFPFAFLIFLVPLPGLVADWLETASQFASAEVADFLFTLFATPVLRDGLFFQLPGITIRVAQECSGIRSSLVLFMTSLLASYLFLRSGWRRAILVAFVIPLALLRNGLRIAFIGWLCANYGPGMIDSPIHHQGGPVFFAASLVPLLALVWVLRRGEEKGVSGRPGRSDANAKEMKECIQDCHPERFPREETK